MNEVIQIIKRRRSMRRFKAEQIGQAELDLILEAAIYAPSGHNEQPWHFTVIQNAELLERINCVCREGMALSDVDWIRRLGSHKHYRVTYKAPTLVVVSGRSDAITWQMDCSAAIQNMLLAAESLDIGSVWLGLLRFFFEREDEMAPLALPGGYEPFFGVGLGYKNMTPAVPPRKADAITYIR